MEAEGDGGRVGNAEPLRHMLCESHKGIKTKLGLNEKGRRTRIFIGQVMRRKISGKLGALRDFSHKHLQPASSEVS